MSLNKSEFSCPLQQWKRDYVKTLGEIYSIHPWFHKLFLPNSHTEGEGASLSSQRPLEVSLKWEAASTKCFFEVSNFLVNTYRYVELYAIQYSPLFKNRNALNYWRTKIMLPSY